MKLTACLGVPLFALLALPAGVRAAAPDASANPYSGLDPDGVPLSISQGLKTTTSNQTDAQRQQADADARARNWLLLDYQQQLQRNKADASPNGQALNMYLQLSMNKDFSQVVNQAMPTPPPPSLHATPSPTTPRAGGMNLRADTTANRGFTPLISPLSSPLALEATRPFNASAYASALPASLAPSTAFGAPPAPAPAPAPNPTPASLPTSPADTVDMQTPGMVADKSNPLPGTPDLSLDSLPEQNSNNPQQPTDAPPQLAQPAQAMDADQLHAAVDAKLNSPKVALNTTANQPKQPEPAKPTQPPPPEAPSPISQQPQISPVHAPLPSPFDILNR